MSRILIVSSVLLITAGLRPVLSYPNGYLDWPGTRANPENNAAPTETALRVLDAQRAFNETMSAYYDARADYRRAATRLEAVAGQEVIP